MIIMMWIVGSFYATGLITTYLFGLEIIEGQEAMTTPGFLLTILVPIVGVVILVKKLDFNNKEDEV